MIFTIRLYFVIIIIKNILLFFLTIEINVLKSKLSNIKIIFILFLNIFKFEINAAMLKLNVFKLIIIKNIKITNLINIISNKIFCEN